MRRRSRFDRPLRLLIVLNMIVVGLLALMMVLDWLHVIPARGTASESLAPAVTATPETMQMGLAHIPTSNSCLLCHEKGGAAELKPIPAVGHQIEGWTAFLTCHDDRDLGRKAPGHNGIAESECLNCHKDAPEGPAITQAHADLHEPCLDCHGSVAHLPSSMVGRDQDECWLCHKPNPAPPPTKPHPDPQNLTCRSCHQSSQAGALPIDHALREEDTCTLCHDINGSLAPSASAPAVSSPAAPAATGEATPSP